jgi:hypothetical protein
VCVECASAIVVVVVVVVEENIEIFCVAGNYSYPFVGLFAWLVVCLFVLLASFAIHDASKCGGVWSLVCESTDSHGMSQTFCRSDFIFPSHVQQQ